jgi:hypothetical protein
VDDPLGYAIRRGIRAAAKATINYHGAPALRGIVERVCGEGPNERMIPMCAALGGIGSATEIWNSL